MCSPTFATTWPSSMYGGKRNFKRGELMHRESMAVRGDTFSWLFIVFLHTFRSSQVQVLVRMCFLCFSTTIQMQAKSLKMVCSPEMMYGDICLSPSHRGITASKAKQASKAKYGKFRINFPWRRRSHPRVLMGLPQSRTTPRIPQPTPLGPAASMRCRLFG